MLLTRSYGTWLPEKHELRLQLKCAWNYNGRKKTRNHLTIYTHPNHIIHKAHQSSANSSPRRSYGRWRKGLIFRLQGHGNGFLVCQSLKVKRALATVANMYSTQKNSMTVSLTVNMWHKTTNLEALMDCGATHNFIDPWTIKTLAMGTNPLKQPLIVHNIDRTINQGGTITHYCNLWVQWGTQVEKLGFYVANLGWDRLILGYPWFKKFNPNFNWNTNTLEGDTVEIDTARYWTKITSSLQAVELSKGATNEERRLIQSQILATYHQYWEVFSKQASYRFPPEREEDHAIILKEGAPDKINCKIYRQTVEELEATHQFITESLAKEYIMDSKSPYMSALFYRKKKDGKLQPIMDYQILNKWTIRDNYPLPLITNIIEQLQGKTLFSKFNIHWGYNNIRIWKEDQWKAAFKTPFGLYEPTVMYFGLTNSPATFCRCYDSIGLHLASRYIGLLYFLSL